MVDLLDALDIPQAVLAGYDWGGRAACVAAALWPDRVTGLVSVNSYLIQDISTAMHPIRPDLEAGFWYFFYFLTDRGRAGLTANRREIAEVIWRRNSPGWAFDDADLDRAAEAFDEPRLRRRRDPLLPSPPRTCRRLGRLRGARTRSRHRARDRGPGGDAGRPGRWQLSRHRRQVQRRTLRRSADPPSVPNAGHNLPHEAPAAFVRAVAEVFELAVTGRGAALS